MPTTPAPAPFRVLVVCTGNICRSPAVERLLAAGLGAAAAPGGDVAVASAGTGAVVGAPVSPPMAELVAAAGADVGGFAARQLTPALLREADLVLALTRRHRAAVVDLLPAAVRRTFVLRELTRLASGVDPAALPPAASGPGERLRALVPLAAARRGLEPAPADGDDVVDPYRGDAALYRRSFDELRPAVDALVAVARG